MSQYTIINDISVTLLKLLKAGMEGIVDQDHISLESPADIEADNTPRLTIYLYQMAENQYRKNYEMVNNSASHLCKPPLSLYLFYLLTAYASSRGSEQQILGKAVQILYDNNIIRGSALQGSLARTFDELVIDINPLSMDDMNKLWNMFGNKVYKLSVTYRVASALIDSTVEKEEKRVIQKHMHHFIPQ